MKDVQEKLTEFLEALEKDSTVLEFQALQEELLKDKAFLREIEKLHSIYPESPEYQECKHILFTNPTYKNYLKCHQTLHFYTLEMSQKLKDLIREEKYESH